MVVVAAVCLFAFQAVDRGSGFPAGIACEQVRQRAEEFLAETLSGPLSARITEHLAACDACDDYVRGLRSREVGHHTDAEILVVAR